MASDRFASLASGFLHAVRASPDAIALELSDRSYSYGELWRIAGRMTSHLRATASGEPLVAVLARRNLVAYAGILGVVAAGRGYVPLNPKFPVSRLTAMLSASGCTTIIVGSDCVELAGQVLAGLERDVTVVCLDGDAADLVARGTRVVAESNLPPAPEPSDPAVEPSAAAYLLFTSGSTGVPKGVAISTSNVTAYLRYTDARYGLRPTDRCSQMFDLTFDLSVHDMFACWAAGATLCPVPDSKVMLPAQFVKEKRLTAWFSVPSVASALSRARLLKPGSFPSLRWSLFCGEPLTASLASAWQAAAPSSVVENLYGPTEATIAISQYRWSNGPADPVDGIVPIGDVFAGSACAVVSESGAAVPDGEIGELCLHGPQVASGYWHDPEKTKTSFTPLKGYDGIWYHTGDLVRRDPAGCLHYCGRMDQQVKIGGFRVELQEIEGVLRHAAGTEQAVAVPWPLDGVNPSGIIGVLGPANVASDADVIRACREKLPHYMVPRQIVRFEELSLNANGKLDRKAVVQRLKERESE